MNNSKVSVISVIEDEDVIKKILKHLGLWELKARPPPKATGSTKITEFSIDYSPSDVGPYRQEVLSHPQGLFVACLAGPITGPRIK